MKINKLIFSSILLFSTLINTGCSSNKDKISSYYADGLDSFIHLDNTEAIDLVNNKQDFILFLYSDCGCGGATDSIIETFNSFIKETNLVIYAIGSTYYQKLPLSMENYFPLYPTDSNKQIEDIPALYFYNNGSLISSYTYSAKFKSIDGINELIYSKVEKNGVYLLNKFNEFIYDNTYYFYKFDYSDTSILDDKINNYKVTILYSWYKCSDCQSLKSIIKDYLKEKDKKIYFFEVNHFRDKNNKSTLWDDEINGFPYIYQFASYRQGKVPCFVSYVNGIKTSSLVYHNDVVVDGIIQESFFEELVGQRLSESEQENYHEQQVINYLDSMEN